MQFRQLLYFVTVARHLNFSQAAAELHVAQPAISQQVKALENELGVALFSRAGRRIALTEAGRTLLPHARQILAALEAAEHDVRASGSLAHGRVSLGAPPTVSTHLLPERLTQFKQSHPGLDVTLREAGTETLLSLLPDGVLDLAIVAAELLPPVLDRAEFLREQYVLAVSSQHPSLSRLPSVRLIDLAAEPFILFPDGYKLREVTLNACRRAGFEPKVALDGGAMQSALEFVGAGLGVALVPELALTKAQHIRSLPIDDQVLERTLSLVWLKGHPLTPAARALRDFLATPKRQ